MADAIGKARILYDKDKRSVVSVKTVLRHFGFGENLSGSSARVISALRQFGLLEDVGDNYRVSDAAYLIFSLSDGSPKRAEALKACVNKPAVYREVLRQYPDGLPSDDAVKDFLIEVKKFNPASVDTFLRVFKASLSFAKVTVGAYTEDSEGEEVPKVSVGDFIQWESQGVLQFEGPKAVLRVSDDGAYAFVEGTNTGIPMDQIQKVEQPPLGGPPPATPPPGVSKSLPPAAGTAREVSNVEKGEVLLQWPVDLGADEVEEIEDWLALVVKKMKRRYGNDAKKEQ